MAAASAKIKTTHDWNCDAVSEKLVSALADALTVDEDDDVKESSFDASDLDAESDPTSASSLPELLELLSEVEELVAVASSLEDDSGPETEALVLAG